VATADSRRRFMRNATDQRPARRPPPPNRCLLMLLRDEIGGYAPGSGSLSGRKFPGRCDTLSLKGERDVARASRESTPCPDRSQLRAKNYHGPSGTLVDSNTPIRHGALRLTRTGGTRRGAGSRPVEGQSLDAMRCRGSGISGDPQPVRTTAGHFGRGDRREE